MSMSTPDFPYPVGNATKTSLGGASIKLPHTVILLKSFQITKGTSKSTEDSKFVKAYIVSSSAMPEETPPCPPHTVVTVVGVALSGSSTYAHATHWSDTHLPQVGTADNMTGWYSWQSDGLTSVLCVAMRPTLTSTSTAIPKLEFYHSLTLC